MPSHFRPPETQSFLTELYEWALAIWLASTAMDSLQVEGGSTEECRWKETGAGI